MPNNDEQNEDWLIDDDVTSVEQDNQLVPWKILIVDDEADIHAVTRIALQNVEYKNRPLLLISAFSAKEGMEILSHTNDIAIILLDVMMETDDAGLRMARQIREELQNQLVRVILRTGQPGHAPEREVILQYDINDYKNKTELTSQKLFTTIIASLRAYEGLLLIERSRIGIERILDASTDLYQSHSLQAFASSVLQQISTILDVGADGVLCLLKSNAEAINEVPIIVAATGNYTNLLDQTPLSTDSQLWQIVTETFQNRRSHFAHPVDSLYVETHSHRRFVILVSPPSPLAASQCQLLEKFCDKIAWAYDNLHRIQDLQNQQLQFANAVNTLLLAIQNDDSTQSSASLKLVFQHLEQQLISQRNLQEDLLLQKLSGALNNQR